MVWSDGWSVAGWGWFGLLHLLWWLLIIAGIVALVRWIFGGGGRIAPAPRENRALEILRERYARGEISKEEYEERKRVLEG